MDNNEEMKEWLGKDEKVRESGGKNDLGLLHGLRFQFGRGSGETAASSSPRGQN